MKDNILYKLSFKKPNARQVGQQTTSRRRRPRATRGRGTAPGTGAGARRPRQPRARAALARGRDQRVASVATPTPVSRRPARVVPLGLLNSLACLLSLAATENLGRAPRNFPFLPYKGTHEPNGRYPMSRSGDTSTHRVSAIGLVCAFLISYNLAPGLATTG